MNRRPPIRTYQRKNKASSACIVHHPSLYRRDLWGDTYDRAQTATESNGESAVADLGDSLQVPDYFETTFDRIAKGVTYNPPQSQLHEIVDSSSNSSSILSSPESRSHKEVSRHLRPINSDLSTIKPRTPEARRAPARRKNGKDSEMVVVTKRFKSNRNIITKRKAQTTKITTRKKQPPSHQRQLRSNVYRQGAGKEPQNLNTSDSDPSVEENSNAYPVKKLCNIVSQSENMDEYGVSSSSSSFHYNASAIDVKCSTPICSRLVKVRESISCLSPITIGVAITNQVERLEEYPKTKQETVRPKQTTKIISVAPEKKLNISSQDYACVSPFEIGSIKTAITNSTSLDFSLKTKNRPNRKYESDEMNHSHHTTTSASTYLSENMFESASDNDIYSAVNEDFKFEREHSAQRLSSNILSLPSYVSQVETVSPRMADGDVLTAEKTTEVSLQPPTENFELGSLKKAEHSLTERNLSGLIYDTTDECKKDAEPSELDSVRTSDCDASSVKTLQEDPKLTSCFVTMTRGTKKVKGNFISENWSSQFLNSSARSSQYYGINMKVGELHLEKQDADSLVHTGITRSLYKNSDSDISQGLEKLRLQKIPSQHDLRYGSRSVSMNVRKERGISLLAEGNDMDSQEISVTSDHNSIISSMNNSTNNHISSGTYSADEDNGSMCSQFTSTASTERDTVECSILLSSSLLTSGSSISGVEDTENVSITESGLHKDTEKLEPSLKITTAGHYSDDNFCGHQKRRLQSNGGVENTVNRENHSWSFQESVTLSECQATESAPLSMTGDSKDSPSENSREQSWDITSSSLESSHDRFKCASGESPPIVPKYSYDSSDHLSDQTFKTPTTRRSVCRNRDLPLGAENAILIFEEPTAKPDNTTNCLNQSEGVVQKKYMSCAKSKTASSFGTSRNSGSSAITHVSDSESRNRALMISNKKDTTNSDKTDENNDTILNISKAGQTLAVFLKPGKHWARSLSILNNIQTSHDIEPLCAGKGKKWRQSVQTVLNMQHQGVIQSCIKENEDDNRDAQSSYGANNSTVECLLPRSEGWNIAGSTGSPNRFIRRMSIRVVPNNKSFDNKEDTFFLGAYGFAPTKNRTTFSENSTALLPNKQTLVYNVQCKDVAVEATEVRPVVTAREAVLQKCSQEDYLPFSSCFPKTYLECCRKIGEGVYGEVFLYENGRAKSVIKIIPIEGTQLVNGEPQKRFDEILTEIVIAKELHCMRFGVKHKTSGFAQVKNVRCIVGKYPDKLVELWKIYDNEKGSDNDCPSMFLNNQLYIALELGHGGQDLEAFVFRTAAQSHALFIQTALALAVAERSLEFEHRDLHWGNILISATKDSRIHYKLDGKEVYCPSKGVQVAIIDFTLSRMSYEGCCIFNDLALDPALFTAQGEYQFEIYRLMRDKIGNNWQKFEPYTNILWLHYTLDKMITAVRYRKKTTKIHKNGILLLQELKDVILGFNSVHDFVTNCDKVTSIVQSNSDSTIIAAAETSPRI